MQAMPPETVLPDSAIVLIGSGNFLTGGGAG
jgi:hypothetical protein